MWQKIDVSLTFNLQSIFYSPINSGFNNNILVAFLIIREYNLHCQKQNLYIIAAYASLNVLYIYVRYYVQQYKS